MVSNINKLTKEQKVAEEWMERAIEKAKIEAHENKKHYSSEQMREQQIAHKHTYGKGINPEAVPDLVESLIKAIKLLNEFSEILVGEWNDDVIDGESVEDSTKKFKEALKKAEL